MYIYACNSPHVCKLLLLYFWQEKLQGFNPVQGNQPCAALLVVLLSWLRCALVGFLHALVSFLHAVWLYCCTRWLTSSNVRFQMWTRMKHAAIIWCQPQTLSWKEICLCGVQESVDARLSSACHDGGWGHNQGYSMRFQGESPHYRCTYRTAVSESILGKFYTLMENVHKFVLYAWLRALLCHLLVWQALFAHWKQLVSQAMWLSSPWWQHTTCNALYGIHYVWHITLNFLMECISNCYTHMWTRCCLLSVCGCSYSPEGLRGLCTKISASGDGALMWNWFTWRKSCTYPSLRSL